MAELLLGARDEAPETVCGCCGRAASRVGVLHPPGAQVLWICVLCNPINGIKVADMNPTKLIETEAQALDKATAETISDVVDALFTQLGAHGVRDLEALDAEKLGKITADAAASADYREAVRKTFLAYSMHVRTLLTNIKE